MVSARLVECPESPEVVCTKPIPEMMFAAGEEPVGVRVLTYQSSGAIKRILNTLEAEEVEIIRRSAFGKIIDIADKPVFSGRFARYMLSRQLKTKKKHEVWFRFAGKPVRFSLREFAIVTGLPCGKFPRRSKLKLKQTISEKPYWPSLFGKSDYLTVASIIKMLRRKTVKDRDIRIKFACLSILESVFLPTSLKMKICRDHAEAIKDIEEFFSYPWGRMAFDMLMCSIKERDEVALTKNTIAIKGFALALQLVMVEAVPSLTEVVQESCSSSESDSEDDVLDPRWAKKQTLSPTHARNVDKKSHVVVRSILSQDSDRPVDEASVLWSDEEEDETVDNMVELINSNYTFVHSMFVGGVTKMEVDHMRENSKPAMKTKESKQHSSSTVDIDPGFVGSLVIEHIKPHVAVMELKLNQTSRRIDSIESYLTGYLESLMGKFKEEMLQTITSMVITYLGKGHSAAPHDPHLNPPETHNFVSGNLPYMIPLADDNAKSIRNVMENLSDYSTPPSSPRNCQAENTLSPTIALGQSGLLMSAPVYQGMAHSAHSQNHIRQIDMNQLSGVDKVVPRDLMDMPSFTLGITQEENMKGAGEGVVKESVNGSPLPDLNFADNIEDPQTSRKSKRQKMVPSDLVENYHCGPHILSRLRRSQKFVFIWYDQREVERKFLKLSHQLACNSVINVAGLSVSSKEIILIAERSRIFPPKVVDILIHLVRSVVLQHLSNENLHSCYFLDTKFGSALVRSYPKFKKLKNKESYSFPKGVLALVNDDGGTPLQARGYYFPFSLGKEHWVGVYFDTVQGHLSVLDCNMSYSNEASVAKFLTPLLHMLPYLSTRGSMDIVREEVMPFRFDRPKVVSQIDHLPDSGLMAVLLMVTHAVYGIDACKNISTTSLSEEGKSAAIMAYEFKEKL